MLGLKLASSLPTQPTQPGSRLPLTPLSHFAHPVLGTLASDLGTCPRALLILTAFTSDTNTGHFLSPAGLGSHLGGFSDLKLRHPAVPLFPAACHHRT